MGYWDIEVFSSRSALLTRQSCPRRWWWEYGIPIPGSQVPGIAPTKLNMDLLIGSGYHVGDEYLLKGHSLEESIGRALEGDGMGWPGVWPLLKSKGLVLGDKEDAYYVYHETASLVEALIRGFHYAVLPDLLTRFTVVEVERDGEEILSIGDVPDFQVRWGYRADALLLEKETQDLYILSLKTTKEWNKKKEDMGHRDMQGLSEVASVDQRLQRWNDWQGDKHYEAPEWFRERQYLGASPHVFGVKMEYALKGSRREYPYGSGKYYYSNPLIRPWKKQEAEGPPVKRRGKPLVTANFSSPYAVNWEFQDDLGGNHTLGKGWRPVPIWEDMGVKNWMEILASESIQGLEVGEPIRQQFVSPIEFFRSDEAIERWKRKVVFSEHRNYLGRKAVLESTSPGEYESYLDEHYDTHTERCDYPNKCPFQEICFGPEAYLFDPLSSGSYEPRTPNHQNELIQIEG